MNMHWLLRGKSSAEEVDKVNEVDDVLEVYALHFVNVEYVVYLLHIFSAKEHASSIPNNKV